MKMKIARKLSILGLLAILLGVVSQPTVAAPSRPDFNTSGLGFTMALLDSNPVAYDMGARWAEYTVSWAIANPLRGSYNWGDADNIMNNADGLNIILRIMDTPAWARPGGTPSSTPPSNMADFTTFMRELTSHLNAIGRPPAAFEIWNEVNLDYNWGNQCPNPTRYMQLVQAASSGVRVVNGNIKIVAGAVTTVAEYRPDAPDSYDPATERKPLRGIDGRLSECHLDDILFIRGMYQNTAGIPASVFDVLSTHPYGFNNLPQHDPRTANYLTFRRAELQRNEMVANGDAAKKMWATEMGWAVNPAGVQGADGCAQPNWYFIWSEQEQADNLVGAVQWARSYWPWMEVMVVFDFDFSLAPWYDRCHPFNFFAVYGYHTRTGYVNAPRPAYNALAAWIANPPATYTPIAPPATNTPVATATPAEGPPLVSNVVASQTRFARNGGTLTVNASVSDLRGTPVGQVYLVVNEPVGAGDTLTPTHSPKSGRGGTIESIVPMTLVSGDNRSGTWRGSYSVPANGSSGELRYSFNILANDTAGNSTSSPLQFFTISQYRFFDVPDSFWAAGYINSLAARNIIGGYSDGSFRPDNQTRRDEIAKLLSIAYGWPLLNPATATFSDVPTTHWAYRYIETAAARQVVLGYGDGRFHPELVVKRDELSKMIVKGAAWPLQNPPTPHFSDVPTTHWAYRYIETAYSYGVINGYAGGTFLPSRQVSRAEISKILYTQLQVMGQTTATPTHTAAPGSTPAPATATRTAAPSSTPTSTPAPASTATPGGPVANSIAPDAVVRGSNVIVTISGSGFGSSQGGSTLVINNTAMTIAGWSNESIYFRVPYSTPGFPTPADVQLTIGGQSVPVPGSFTVLPGAADGEK